MPPTRLRSIVATPGPTGGCIDVHWVFADPGPGTSPGEAVKFRILRRERTYPATPTDGVIIADNTGEEDRRVPRPYPGPCGSVRDSGLQGEATYYYAMFCLDETGFAPDPLGRAYALSCSPFGFSDLLYSWLPAIYRRYDEDSVPNPDPRLTAEDQNKGPLRRFLDLPGAQFDQLYAMVRASLDLYDLDRTPANMLPLLADWIGWRTNYGLDPDEQRNEIRFAPYFYHTVGLAPSIEATVMRLSGWSCRTKEFVHNVARTNAAERLNLWQAIRAHGQSDFGPAELMSLNFAYAGRAAAISEADGSISFFYHTHRVSTSGIWTKSIVDMDWQPSKPIVDRKSLERNPTAVRQDSKLWLFWEHYEQAAGAADGKWQINVSVRQGDRQNFQWSPPAIFGSPGPDRRSPAAAIDDGNGIWVFWMEQGSAGWHIAYDHNDGAKWLDSPVSLIDTPAQPRQRHDLFAFIHPAPDRPRIWLFWAWQDIVEQDEVRWTIAYRCKASLQPDVNDWSPIRTLNGTEPARHDREPCAILAGDGSGIELYWSSSATDGWSIWNATLDTATLALTTPVQVKATPYTNRAPLAVRTQTHTLLALRSNESVAHVSDTYGTTRTRDFRFSGSTTVDTRNRAKLLLRGEFDDFQTYTWDSGRNGLRTSDNLIAGDTVGVYLQPTAGRLPQIAETRSRIEEGLNEFMPVSERAALILPAHLRVRN